MASVFVDGMNNEMRSWNKSWVHRAVCLFPLSGSIHTSLHCSLCLLIIFPAHLQHPNAQCGREVSAVFGPAHPKEKFSAKRLKLVLQRKIITIKREEKIQSKQMNEDEGKSMVIKTTSWVHLILPAHVPISTLVNPIAVQPLWLVAARWASLVSQNVSRIFIESTFRWLVCVHFSLLIVKW